MKTFRRIFGASLCALLIAVLAVFSACGAPNYSWDIPDLGDKVDFHTEKQAEYLASSDYDNLEFVSGAEESLPNAVTLKWTATSLEKEPASLKGYTVEISTSQAFPVSETTTIATTATSCELYNLYVGTEYYWRVTVEDQKGKATSPTQYFRTTDYMRNIYVDGVTNMRDIGGWETEDGGHVKQGMIYRCGRLNIGNADNYYPAKYTECITAEGKKTMLEQLGIKSEIDLRRTDNDEVGYLPLAGGNGPLGDGVKYVQMPMEWSIGTENDSNNLASRNKDKVKEFFSYLAHEENYPIIFHCNIGTDRTGVLAYLVNALLGVGKEGLHRDYMFSNLGNITGARSITKITNTYGKMLDEYNGATLSEKTKNYLINEIGVTAEEIDTIKELLIV